MYIKLKNYCMFWGRIIGGILFVPIGLTVSIYGILGIISGIYYQDLEFITFAFAFLGLIVVLIFSIGFLCADLYIIITENGIVGRTLFKKKEYEWNRVKKISFNKIESRIHIVTVFRRYDMLEILLDDRNVYSVKISYRDASDLLIFLEDSKREYLLSKIVDEDFAKKPKKK